MAERITTLLQDRLPVDSDRRLKVPAIRPEDDMVAVRRRLGRYLYDSLEKDTDRKAVAKATANAIWPGCTPIDRDTDAEVARDLRRTESKTGSPAIALRHPAGRILIIGLGPHKPMLARIDYRYRLSKRTVDTVSLPSLLAARMIMEHMANPDPEGPIRDLLTDDRHTWQYFRTNMDRRFEGVDGLVVSCNTRGVSLPDPPEAGDAKALLAWTVGAGLIGLDCDDERAKRLLAERLEWVRWTAELRLAAETILRVESDWRMNRDLARRTEAGVSATVFEDKKHRDPKHDKAGQASPFAMDFDRIEVEDDVDLALFARLGAEWEALKPAVPMSGTRAALRFRYTGRHRADGVYHTGLRAIAIDPRHPESFGHELMHHLDHTWGGTDLSLDPLFRPLLDHYRETVDTARMKGANPDRWLAPAEAFARAGEIWLHMRLDGAENSLLSDGGHYETDWAYAPYRGRWNEIGTVFDRLFA
ncbi:hypothetical protein BLLJ_1045 [Bifidobacterium longum subsp. longum JCM 1217]|uniref:Uncharacterized protein n=2 Tax=Bifidobacterium longum TaxID=216816 RepID=A0AA45ZQH0_BIFLN|nr:hypothetical protein [Bifidobacterium longum]EPE38925.1 hypothetical protein I118_1194 [Bifidobacterium longum D2957]KFI63295.1 hypothetical protein BLSL_1032 [Bifidobacterium longum subsp. longum]MED7651495.1 hypothetical protein [Bifidobacterium longum]QSG88696.1 hypothetical protein BLL128_09685 [Bifidobacterium longum subsp. longum]RGW05268.1 hypothetical protein DWV93_09470 [Bifidobacterium longum]